MEGLRFRLVVFATALIALGVYLNLSPKSNVKPIAESWVEDHTPKIVGDMHAVPGKEGDRFTYKMDQRTYDLLMPEGICARVFTNGRESYDAVVIASRTKESFHDPKQCFSAQDWDLMDGEKYLTIHTKTRGDIPATIVQMRGKQSANTFAVYFYKGPGGFKGSNKAIKTAMFWEQLLHGDEKLDGAFFRFIPNFEGATKEQLLRFVADYMDEAGRTSNNYF